MESNIDHVGIEPYAPPPRLITHALCDQEYVRYKERLLKAENQLVNALGFDFMIEHPFGHASDLVAYLTEEGEARRCRRELKPCVVYMVTRFCRRGCDGLDCRESSIERGVASF